MTDADKETLTQHSQNIRSGTLAGEDPPCRVLPKRHADEVVGSACHRHVSCVLGIAEAGQKGHAARQCIRQHHRWPVIHRRWQGGVECVEKVVDAWRSQFVNVMLRKRDTAEFRLRR